MDDVQQSETVLLLIDLINPFDYPGAEALLAQTRRILPEIRALRERFEAQGLATVYVNDNFGRWRSSFAETVEHCLSAPGRVVVEQIRPRRTDYFVLKPHRSGFYATALHALLQALGAKKLVFAGVATDMCVLSTVSDAQMRGYETIIPSDCTTTLTQDRHECALNAMRNGIGTQLVRGATLP